MLESGGQTPVAALRNPLLGLGLAAKSPCGISFFSIFRPFAVVGWGLPAIADQVGIILD
jgi:hypothetical protein